MELLGQVDIVDSFRGRDHALVSLLIHEDAIDRVVKIQFVETWGRLTLQQVGIVVPEVKITVVYSQEGIVETALDGKDLSTADLLAPRHLVSLSIYDTQLPLASAKDQVISVVVGQIVA